MPWELDWYRTSLMLVDGTWEHEFEGSRKDFYKDHWVQKRWQVRADYLDEYDSTWIGSTLHIREREWRPRAFKWTSLFSKIRRTLEVEYDREVGPKKGSWKGGTMATGFNIKTNADISKSIEELGFRSIQFNRDHKLNELGI